MEECLREDCGLWSDVIHGLKLIEQKDQPDCDIRDYFERMALDQPFVLRCYHVVEDAKGQVKEVLFAKDVCEAKINLIQTTDRLDCLIVTIEVIGIPCHGIKRGVYTLKIDSQGDIEKLPTEIFDQEYAPTMYILENWPPKN